MPTTSTHPLLSPAKPGSAVPRAIVCDVIDRLNQCSLSECNGHFQDLVVRRILATGRHVDDFTVGEIRALIAQASVDFNRAWAA